MTLRNLTLLVFLLALLPGLSMAQTCHNNPLDIINDDEFKPMHPLVMQQEYVGNIGKTLKSRKEHDTYFNWESKGSFYGRVYNTKYEKAVDGPFSICKIDSDFIIKMSAKLQIPFQITKKGVQIKFKGITFSLFPYPLKRHGTLRFKLKSANFPIRVVKPRRFIFPN